MPYHFTRVTRVLGQEFVHNFDADSLPSAKKTARRHWEHTAKDNPLRAVTVELRKRMAWSLRGDQGGTGEVIAQITGVNGDKPHWIKDSTK